jgi:hypothetical protein
MSRGIGIVQEQGICHPFRISPSWSCMVSFEYMLTNMRFICSLKGQNGRPYIVLNKPYETMDMFEIGYFFDGLTTKGDLRFNDFTGDNIEDSSLDAIDFISRYLIKEGAHDLICNT